MGNVVNYDAIAPYYDFLVELVFGNKLHNAESYFIPKINKTGKVLIFGGGTGKILDPLFSMHPKTEIYYLEASSAMIAIARKRFSSEENVHFIHGKQDSLRDLDTSFDTIITSFILDIFGPDEIEEVLSLLLTTLNQGGNWLHTDFVISNSSPFWHKLLIRSMYQFFRITTTQQNQQLPDWDPLFDKLPLNLIDQKHFVNGMVRSTLYQKSHAADPNH